MRSPGNVFRLNQALDLATQDRTPLSDRVVNATLRLRGLLEAACSTTYCAQWLRDTLRAIGRIPWLATPPPPSVSAAVKTPPAAEGTINGPPYQARIVTPACTPDGLNETDGKYPLLYSMLRNMIATHHRFRHEYLGPV